MGRLVPNKGGWYKCWVIKARSKNESAAKFLQSQMLLLLIFSGYLGARTEWWSALTVVVDDDDLLRMVMMMTLNTIIIFVFIFIGYFGIHHEWWSAFALLLFVQLVALPTSLLFWQNIKTMSFVSFQKILASLSQIVTEGFSILEKLIFPLNQHSCGFSYVLTIGFLWMDVIECSCYLLRWQWWLPSISSSSSSLR